MKIFILGSCLIIIFLLSPAQCLLEKKKEDGGGIEGSVACHCPGPTSMPLHLQFLTFSSFSPLLLGPTRTDLLYWKWPVYGQDWNRNRNWLGLVQFQVPVFDTLVLVERLKQGVGISPQFKAPLVSSGVILLLS